MLKKATLTFLSLSKDVAYDSFIDPGIQVSLSIFLLLSHTSFTTDHCAATTNLKKGSLAKNQNQR